LLSDCRSVQVGCTRFSRCCYLISGLCSPFRRELVQALSQSPDLGGRARLFGYYLSFFLLSFFLLFPVFDREISSQDRLGTMIANPSTPSILCFVSRPRHASPYGYCAVVRIPDERPPAGRYSHPG
jgi:hypothetical protein